MSNEAATLAFADGARHLAEETARLLDAGAPTDEIAAAFGVQHKAVAARLRRNGYTTELNRFNRQRFAEAERRTGRRVANGRYAA